MNINMFDACNRPPLILLIGLALLLAGCGIDYDSEEYETGYADGRDEGWDEGESWCADNIERCKRENR